jgi:hypothetical protein
MLRRAQAADKRRVEAEAEVLYTFIIQFAET